MSDFNVITPYEARLLAFLRFCHPETELTHSLREKHDKNKNSIPQMSHQMELDLRLGIHVDEDVSTTVTSD